MSSFFFSKFKGALIGGIVKNVSITESQLDMNSKNIHNVADPVVQLDAANKKYVDFVVTQSIRYNTINLTGTDNYITIVPDLYGSFYLTVSGVAEGSPCATFAISKNHRNNELINGGNRLSNYIGYNTQEYIKIRWLSGNGIQVAKSGSNYDGVYIIKIV